MAASDVPLSTVLDLVVQCNDPVVVLCVKHVQATVSRESEKGVTRNDLDLPNENASSMQIW